MNFVPTIVFLLSAFLLFGPGFNPLFGQTGRESVGTSRGGLESCFAYYNYGKVQLHLGLDKASYLPGQTARISGTVVNGNTFPLVDVVLYAQLKRVNRTETFVQNGHFLVDRLTLAENLNFAAGETKAIEQDLPLAANYPRGEYQLQYFVFSKHGFHYSGRPFLEEDTAGYSSFNILGGEEPQVYFDIDSLQVGGEPHNVRELISEFRFGPISITVRVLDNRGDQGERGDLRVRLAYYKFEDTFEENKVLEREIRIDSGRVESVFLPPEPGAYVFLAEIEEPVRSLFKYRFAVAGEKAPELRMNDVGVTNFPATPEGRAYVCFHSPTNNTTPPTKITLALLDSDKTVVDEKNVTQEFASNVMAISLGLDRLTTPEDFWIRTQFVQPENLAKSREVEIHYNCARFRDSIASLSTAYDQDTRAITFGGVNICGEAIGRGGYIESLRVSRNGEVVREEYNMASPRQFTIADLVPGTYTTEIKGSAGTQELEFTVPPQAVRGWRRTAFLWMSFVIVAGGGISVYIWVKKRRKGVI